MSKNGRRISRCERRKDRSIGMEDRKAGRKRNSGVRNTLSCFALWLCYGTLDARDTVLHEERRVRRAPYRHADISWLPMLLAAPDPGRLN